MIDRDKIIRVGNKTDLLILAVLDELKVISKLISREEKESLPKMTYEPRNMNRKELLAEIKKIEDKPSNYITWKSEELITYLEGRLNE